MENKVSIEITLGDITIVHLEIPLNEAATILTGLEVTVNGLGLRDPYDGSRSQAADTVFEWRASVPVIVPQGVAGVVE